MERKVTESQVVGYLTPEQQLQRALQLEPMEPTNRQVIEQLQTRLIELTREIRSVQSEIAERWERELHE